MYTIRTINAPDVDSLFHGRACGNSQSKVARPARGEHQTDAEYAMMNGLINGLTVLRTTATALPHRCLSRQLAVVTLLALVCLVGTLGCIERTITINTEPDDATVFLNDEEVGRSPVKVAFLWYGDYDIIIRRAGHKTVHTHENVRTPWYEMPGLDLITECLIPFTVHDDRVFNYALEKRETPSNEMLIDRAEELKRHALGDLE